MAKFTLSEEDKKMVLGWGYPESDLAQIEEAANVGTFEREGHGRICWSTAKHLLGNQEWLSGLCRAAFHWTCSRENANHTECISFNCSALFA